MDNPSTILRAVDKRLDHETRLILYGRAALWLGFDSPPSEAGKTQDVDAIISVIQAEELQRDSRFWDAVEGANAELAEQGHGRRSLYDRTRQNNPHAIAGGVSRHEANRFGRTTRRL